MTRAPAVCIPHGGGPMGVLNDPSHKALNKSFQTTLRKLLKLGTPEQPRAIVIVTAHWTTNVPTVSNGKKHNLFYDYAGFPRAAYELTYNAPGEPEVAKEILKLLKDAGLEAKGDGTRGESFFLISAENSGWDHGTFCPLILIHPEADIPVVQLSVLASEDPAQHLQMGAALSSLRSQNIAILGSGFASMHNIRLIMSGQVSAPAFRQKSAAWTGALNAAVSKTDPVERAAALKGWREFPNAYDMHPRGGAEHFLPLLVAAGAGGEGECKMYADDFLGFDAWTYYWA
ncbi:extradiol ring-cleavage dioxygenase class III enzyme subunit B [Coleophoma crateriformis]|uniref:Extradiol ring-cleavage dioxygenase class III enzyme subunit B n=1 Tax=Coleophoma crateriformis TaxID=565419 RepID=A0A3D8RVY5_9HELO|nr:extradiol ring-cleavage dioxygenase class III enzyme subunit B [Coleophoma crateriformis]